MLDANSSAPNADRVHLVDRKLRAIGIAGMIFLQATGNRIQASAEFQASNCRADISSDIKLLRGPHATPGPAQAQCAGAAGERLPPDIEQAAQELASRSRRQRSSQHDPQHVQAAATAEPSPSTMGAPQREASDAADSSAADGTVGLSGRPDTVQQAGGGKDSPAAAADAPETASGAAVAAAAAGKPGTDGEHGAPSVIEAREAEALLDAAVVLPSRADILVTDLFDHRYTCVGLLHRQMLIASAARQPDIMAHNDSLTSLPPPVACQHCKKNRNVVVWPPVVHPDVLKPLQRAGAGAAAGGGLCCRAAAGAWPECHHRPRPGPGAVCTAITCGTDVEAHAVHLFRRRHAPSCKHLCHTSSWNGSPPRQQLCSDDHLEVSLQCRCMPCW